jgi:prevent-host-death family protein
MTAKIISSDQARAKWRELLDTAVAGDPVIIERYGKPVAVLIPYQDYAESSVVRERTAVYQTQDWQTLKAELIAEIKAELKTQMGETNFWTSQLAQLRQQIAQTGGPMALQTKDEIVTQLRQTRQEIFEAEYAHLY